MSLEIIYIKAMFAKEKSKRRDYNLEGIKFETVEHIGILSENAKCWKKELNLISLNERDSKYDTRDWDPKHVKMGKGITLSKEDVNNLRSLLNNII